MNVVHEQGSVVATIDGKPTRGLSGCPSPCERDCLRRHPRLPILMPVAWVQAKPCAYFFSNNELTHSKSECDDTIFQKPIR